MTSCVTLTHATSKASNMDTKVESDKYDPARKVHQELVNVSTVKENIVIGHRLVTSLVAGSTISPSKFGPSLQSELCAGIPAQTSFEFS